MTAPIDSARLAEILDRHGLSAVDRDPLVLVSRRPGAVIWANGAALYGLGAADIPRLTQTLFHADGAAAFTTRLMRLPSAGPYRLERLPFPGLPTSIAAACHPVDDGEGSLILLHLRGTGLAAPPAPAESTVPAGAVVPVENRLPVTRILWDTDAAGVVTRIDAEARCLGPGAPKLGDDLPERLRATAPDLAKRIAAAARDRGSVGLARFSWLVEGTGTAVAVDAGCTAKRGDAGGLRGFFTVHGAAEVVDPVEPAKGTPAYSAAQPGDAGTESASAVERDMVPVDTEVSVATTPAVLDPAPVEREAKPPHSPPIPDAAAPSPTGNVVHFPVMRLGPVPANFVPALRPAPSVPSAGLDTGELAAPQWSETPRKVLELKDDIGGLSASERDAFEHIRQVLGTRPFAPLAAPSTPAGQAPAAGSALPATGLPPGVPQLLDRLPIGLRLDVAGAAYANAALRDRLGPEAAAALSGRTDLTDLTARDGTPLPAEVVSFDMAGAPAALTIVPAKPSEAPRSFGADTLELVTDGYLRLNEAGIILELSPKAARLMGLAMGEALGRSFASVLADGQAPGWQALAAAATVPEAQPQGPAALRLRTAAGQPVAVQARLGRSDGALLCAFTLDRPAVAPANDTAEAARREAERTSALKSEFLAKVSHEIRTPLNAILGFTEVIRDERLGPVGNARYLEYLRDIHASGTHVMSLVNDLLDLSRIEAGRMDLHLEAVDANTIVQACVNTLQTQAHRERVIVRLSLTPRLPPTLADERSLRQIVLNLLSNAVKFNEPGGQVIVSTALAGVDAVAIRIRDTGIGMSEDEIAAAMEPFRQLSTVNRTGSGLGLPLTKALVEANCASMTIKSTRGEGTLVEVTFPLVEQGSVSLPAE